MVGHSPALARSFALPSAASHFSLTTSARDGTLKTVADTLNWLCRGQSNPSASPVLSSGNASDLQIGHTVMAASCRLRPRSAPDDRDLQKGEDGLSRFRWFFS